MNSIAPFSKRDPTSSSIIAFPRGGRVEPVSALPGPNDGNVFYSSLNNVVIVHSVS